MEWFNCTNDTQRREVFCNLLQRAILKFPDALFPDNKRREAAGYLEQMRSHASPGAPTATPRGTSRSCKRRPELPAQLLEQLRTREAHLRAFIALQKLLLLPLSKWWKQTHKQRDRMLAVEDTCAQSELDRHHVHVLACAEATHILDACFLQADLLLYVPLRAAMLAPFDPQPVVPEEEPQPLRDIEELRDTVSWRPFGQDMPVLGNPLQGQNRFPADLAFDCGIRVTERLIPDFDLISLMFVQSSIEHTLAVHRANDPTCSPFMQSFARQMIPQLQLAVLGEIRLGLKPPQMQRAIWSVMASLQKLCAWSGSSIVNEAAEVVRRTTTTMGGRTVPLEPRYATMTAQVELYRTGLLPPPSIQSLLLPPAPLQAPPVPQKQQQRQQQQQQQELSSSTTSQQGVRGPSHTMAPTTVSASVSAAAQVAGGLDGAAAAGCASAAATGTGEGKHASKNRKRRERERAAKAAAAVAAAAAGEVPAGTAVCGTTTTLAAPGPPAAKPAIQLPETPADILAAAVKAEVNECCVCLEALTSYVLLSCNVKTLYGPFHVMCTTCWLGMETAECPLCRLEVDSLSSQEFLMKLGTV